MVSRGSTGTDSAKSSGLRGTIPSASDGSTPTKGASAELTAATSSKCPHFRSSYRGGAGEGHRQTTAPAGESNRPERGTGFRIRYGYLKTLPDDYTGLRHAVTMKQHRQDIVAKIGLSGRSAPDLSQLRALPAAMTRPSSKSAMWRERRPDSACLPARHRYRY